MLERGNQIRCRSTTTTRRLGSRNGEVSSFRSSRPAFFHPHFFFLFSIAPSLFLRVFPSRASASLPFPSLLSLGLLHHGARPLHRRPPRPAQGGGPPGPLQGAAGPGEDPPRPLHGQPVHAGEFWFSSASMGSMEKSHLRLMDAKKQRKKKQRAERDANEMRQSRASKISMAIVFLSLFSKTSTLDLFKTSLRKPTTS